MNMRLKYIIYPRIQWTLIAVHLIALLGFFSITLFFLVHSYSELVAKGSAASLPQNHIYYQYVSMLMKTLVKNLIFSLLITSLFGMVFFIWFSHKFVGPIVALIGYLRRFQDAKREGKNISELKFRQGDYFHDLADEINRALQAQNEVSSSIGIEDKL